MARYSQLIEVNNNGMKQLSVLFLFIMVLAASCSKTSYTKTRSSRSKAPSRTTVSKHTKASPVLVNFDRSGTMSKALDKAKSTGKYMFLDFYTDYCPPCKIMDKEVFGNRELANYLNENFINVKVNAGKTSGANTASLYGVRAYPTLIFTDSRGNMIMRKEGGTTITTVKYMAEEVLRATAMK